MQRTFIIEQPPHTVIVGVAYIHTDIILLLVENAANTTRFIQTRIESIIIFQIALACAQPREHFVAEWVNNFYFMVICICYEHHVLLRYEMNSKWVLKFTFNANTVYVSIAVQVARIRVTAYNAS